MSPRDDLPFEAGLLGRSLRSAVSGLGQLRRAARQLRGEGVARPAVTPWEPVHPPARARKLARLSMSDGRVRFQPSSGRAAYGVVALARCEAPAMRVNVPVPLRGDRLVRLLEELRGSFEHSPPRAECSCGFYASVGRVPEPSPGEVVLEVKLNGLMFMRADSRRAERQQVLSITVPRRCAALLPGEPGDPTEVGLAEGEPCNKEAVGLSPVGDELIPVCHEHAESRLLSVRELAEAVGVPASFAD